MLWGRAAPPASPPPNAVLLSHTFSLTPLTPTQPPTAWQRCCQQPTQQLQHSRIVQREYTARVDALGPGSTACVPPAKCSTPLPHLFPYPVDAHAATNGMAAMLSATNSTTTTFPHSAT